MKREATRIARNPRHSLARPLSMLALVSAVSVAFSLYFHDAGTAIVGVLGAALVLLAVGMWYSARQVRRSVSELHDSGCVAWPVAAQSDRDSRLRLGILAVDGSGLVLILKSESIRLDWSDVTDVTLQSGGFLRAGRALLWVPTRGTLILDILAPNAVASVADLELEECVTSLKELRAGSLSASLPSSSERESKSATGLGWADYGETCSATGLTRFLRPIGETPQGTNTRRRDDRPGSSQTDSTSARGRVTVSSRNVPRSSSSTSDGSVSRMPRALTEPCPLPRK